MRKKAFTLVELLIVISILGIMAAIALPTFQGHFQKAKEAAAKDNLRILRTTIETYAAKNNGIPPGYPSNDPTRMPSAVFFTTQLIPDYLPSIPVNPLNKKSTVNTIINGTPFPGSPADTDGWIYKPETRTIRIDTSGVDSEGVSYFEY